ncbi:hypothetical protein nbrc107696_08710 [Gordonia spumicola]|uniref:DUF2231 domain-containing protein n=1 Tax=Gordonia spumicola TaxID=589161 RepID=A0A7I9V4R9_9ACTN|nr:DUF2231 domain-containing protein [Gordonia spumicola]GEE00425.1 hypothetical protein nbrc107696_08710 [Gordonia spumicola]
MDTFNGLPLHPLIVHFVVVAVPVAALVGIAAALWPVARAKMGPLPSILALLALIATPIATTAGEALEEKVGHSPALETHTQAGDVVIIGVGCLFGAALLLYLVRLRPVTDRLPLTEPVLKALDIAARVLTVVAAVASIYLVYKAGDSGARAVWGEM